MSREETHKLYVSLSASQTRKRLKHCGFGVRRVETAGNHQAVIIHTATGGHFEQLKALFSDVLCQFTHTELGEPLESIRNLGPTSARWLREAGVRTQQDLNRLGAIAAFQLVREQQPGASLNLLWALAAAIDNRDWRDITDREKAELRAMVENLSTEGGSQDQNGHRADEDL